MTSVTPQQIRDLVKHQKAWADNPSITASHRRMLNESIACLLALADAVEDESLKKTSSYYVIQGYDPSGAHHVSMEDIRWNERIARHLRTAEETDR